MTGSGPWNWKYTQNLRIFFQDVHDIFGSECKHGGKEVAYPVSVYSPLTTHFFEDDIFNFEKCKKKNANLRY